MPLAAGKRLGPYEILSLLGAGGMGEVYRANDPRLGREVAVKLLPAQFSGEEERLQRFEQEARAAGMINHPNLMTIYDIGKDEDHVYIVSELLQGETLRERLGGTPLPPRKVLEYGLQIAHGLAAAHERGIIHRDLKPENIFITRDGRVKILDFGLAKLTDVGPVAEELSKLQTAPGTQPGVVMGTIGYMSPEQVRARPIDHRSDIFTFGAILYEMLTGKRAFQRDSAADTMSAILKEDPPELTSTNRNLPPAMERIVRHCLEKNPEERFQSARDLAFDLEMVSGISGSGPQAPEIPVSKRTITRWLAIAAVLLALAASFMAGRQTRPAQETSQEPPTFQRLTFRRGMVSGARFTPDGQSVVYSAAWVSEQDELFVTRPQSPASRSLGVKHAVLLSVSSGGEMAVLMNPKYRIGWVRPGTLARMPIDGGAPRAIVENVLDADWSPDGKDLAIVRADFASFRIEFPPGTLLHETKGWINNLRFSPAGDRIAFMHHPVGGDDRGVVAVIDLKGKMDVLTEEYASESGLDWSPDGKEIWFTASKEGSNEQPILAVDLNRKTRTLSSMVGNLILQDVLPNGSILLTRDSRRREIVALPPGETRERDLSWFDWSFVRDISDDGKTILFEEQGAGGGPNYSVYIRPTDGAPAVKLGDGYAGGMSRDGSRVVALLPNVADSLVLLPTGAGESRTIKLGDIIATSDMPRLFPDGKRILYKGYKANRPPRWWILDIDTNQSKPLTPEGVLGGSIMKPDQTSVLARNAEGKFMLYPVDEGEPAPVLGFEPADVLVKWADRPNVVFVSQAEGGRIRAWRVNIETGERTFWKEIAPPDPNGVSGGLSLCVTPDGSAYAYTYRRVLSDLYLIRGIQ